MRTALKEPIRVCHDVQVGDVVQKNSGSERMLGSSFGLAVRSPSFFVLLSFRGTKPRRKKQQGHCKKVLVLPRFASLPLSNRRTFSVVAALFGAQLSRIHTPQCSPPPTPSFVDR